MRFGSVCSGIEAASAAWNPLGWKAAWFAEIEPFPCAVLAHHYPDVLNYGDMTKLPARIASFEIEAPDIFCGGTPCQAFSVAGKRESLADERGNLSLIFCDIADSIDAARHIRGLPASIVFWENVPGVLSTKDNAFGCFLAQLCGGDEPLNAPDGWPDAGCVSGPGRTAAWRVLDAQYFGLAQRRKRVFVVASARNDFDPAAVLFEFGGVRRDFAPSREAGQGAARDATPCIAASGGESELIPEIAGTMKSCKDSGGWSNSADHAAAGYMIPVRTLCVATGQAGAEIGVEIAPTLNCNHEQPYIAKPAFAAAFKGGQGSAAGSIGYSEHVAPTLSSADSGSNRTPVVLTHIVNGNSTPEVSTELAFPLRANDGSGNRQALAHAMQVRRLTPRECERLQGFPDDYSLVANRGKPAADGPRYKALGNSWAVPVVTWIGKRIKAAL